MDLEIEVIIKKSMVMAITDLTIERKDLEIRSTSKEIENSIEMMIKLMRP